jgi:alkanesulfonate monooxygenase SsuD/methylene tetrahydromethanopterin reductase-like flavin-dependent oxidoreductase (luciferase family)
MHFGLEVIPFGAYADPRNVLELAQAAEQAGWEGLWLWDHLLMPYGAGDPWVTLSGVAASTQRLKLVTGVSPLPRYWPQNLARLLTGLDLLSQGRLVLGAGLGSVDEEFSRFGLPGEKSIRAEMLDESLQIITSLWSGEPLHFQGKHYTVSGAALQPRPVQQPRPPVWIGGESPPALRRAARWDGWAIGVIDENANIVRPPEQLARDLEYILSHRQSQASFEVAIDGVSQPGKDNLVQAYADAGATWWFETIYGMRGSIAEMLERVKAGPPT